MIWFLQVNHPLAASTSDVCLRKVSQLIPYERRERRVTTDLMSGTTHVLNFGDNILRDTLRPPP